MVDAKTDGVNLTQDADTKEDGVVSRLLAKLPDEETEATENSEDEEVRVSQNETNESQTDTEEETEETEDSEESEEDVANVEITAEIAEVLGLPRGFVGKPMSEAGKSYKETVKWENKNNQQIKELQNQIGQVLNELSAKDIAKVEQEANQEAAAEVPDPVTEPERFSEWLTKRDELIVDKIMAKVNDNPSIKAADQMAVQQLENNTLVSLQAALPEDVKADDVLNKWFDENQEDYKAMVQSGIYKNKPQKLIKDVTNWYKASSFDSLKSEKASDIKKQVHKKTVENLKAKGSKTKTDYSTSPRKAATESSAVGRILGNLERSAAIKAS